MAGDLWLLVGGILLIGLWSWSMRAHDRVDRISREVCNDLQLQRLDEAVALRKLRLQRTVGGLSIERVFSFEFSVNGADRCRGAVCLLGIYPRWVHLDHPEGDIHIDLEGPVTTLPKH